MKKNNGLVMKSLISLTVAGFFLVLVPTFAVAAEKTWQSDVVYYWGERRVIDWVRPKANKNYTIGISVPHLKSPYWVNQLYGLIDEANKLGVKTIVTAAKGYNDLNTQINQVENLMTQKVDAIILGPISFEGNAASAEEAIRRGIPVIYVCQSIKSWMGSGISLVDDYQLGVNNAQWIVQDSRGKANVVVFSGPSGASWSMANSEGVRNTFANYPGIKILAEKFCDVDVATAQSIMENLLQTFKDIDYVIGLDAITHGIGNAVEAAGKTKRIKVVTAYLLEEGLPYVERGSISAGQGVHCVTMGRQSMDIAVMVLNKDPNRPLIAHPISVWITKDNLKSFDRSTQFAPKGWTVPMITGK
jgi:protein TorT